MHRSRTAKNLLVGECTLLRVLSIVGQSGVRLTNIPPNCTLSYVLRLQLFEQENRMKANCPFQERVSPEVARFEWRILRSCLLAGSLQQQPSQAYFSLYFSPRPNAEALLVPTNLIVKICFWFNSLHFFMVVCECDDDRWIRVQLVLTVSHMNRTLCPPRELLEKSLALSNPCTFGHMDFDVRWLLG